MTDLEYLQGEAEWNEEEEYWRERHRREEIEELKRESIRINARLQDLTGETK